MEAILSHILALLRRNKPLARALIVSSEGSSPRTAGSCMLADEHGLLAGSVGGGTLEAQALALARRVLAENSRVLLELDLQKDADMICGGSLRLMVEVLNPADLAHFDALAQQSNCDVWSALNLSSGERRIVSDHVPAGLALSLQSAMAARHDIALAQVQGDTWLLERWRSAPVLLLAGGGHVAQATAQMAEIAGFSVMVMDDRPEFANPQRFPSAISCRVVPDYLGCFAHLPPRSPVYLVILTRGHAYDAVVLEQALLRHRVSPFAYIGMIGSSRKRDAIYADLRQKDFSPAELDVVHCPVGLPIHAETPGEIAVSIIAQCVEQRRSAASKV